MIKIELNKKELLEIDGGGISVGLVLTILGGVTFLIGLIHGFVYPKKCE